MEIKTTGRIYFECTTSNRNKKWVAVDDMKKEISNILDHWNHRNSLETRKTIKTRFCCPPRTNRQNTSTPT